MTLTQLAHELNLSIATISRALNRPGDVAPHTRQRVLAAVHRHGYSPNGTRRALRTQQTRTIGVIVSDIRNYFFASVVKSVDDVARANGYSVLICNADEDSAKEEAVLQLLLDRKVSGVINCSTGANLELLYAFQNAGAVLVDLDRESGLGQVDTVTVDNVRGGELAVEHLVALGHRAISTIAGPQHLSTARGRLAGFQNTLRRYGIPASSVQFGNFKQDSGYDCARKLLSRKNPPTAIFAANNEMTAGLVTYVRTAGIAIPGELSVVGFDDAFWNRYMDPPLTVVAQPTEAMAECAIKLLLARLRGARSVQARVFPPDLIVRGSAAQPQVL